MKKLILLITLITLVHSQDIYCTDTGAIKKQICESIKIGEKNACAYSGSTCKEGYTKCEDYNPTSGFTASTCTDIIPSDSNYKCAVKTDGNTKSCVAELKECSEYATSGGNCIELKAGDGKRCVLINGKCEAHKDECNGLEQKDCADNIPKSNTQKCVWSSNSCTSADRVCSDYIYYSDKYGGSNVETCPKLKIMPSTESTWSCAYVIASGKGTCMDYYNSCEVGNGDKGICESISPLNDKRTAVDELSKCSYSGTTCSKVEKKCLDFDNYINNPSNCALLQTSNDNKMCVSGYRTSYLCKEEYITCDSYNKDITDKSKRDSTTCSNIIPKDPNTREADSHSECYLNSDKNCVIRKKECNQLDSKTCNEHTFDDSSKSNKRCLYTSGECKEIYKTCSAYNTLEASKKNKEDCEIIESTDETNPFLFKCVFNSETKECKKEKKDCDDYKGYDSEKCTSLTTNLDNKHKCVIINNDCTKQEKTCTNYEGSTKAECEAIIHEKINYKCIFNSEKKCVEEQRPCDEYSGFTESECETYKPSISGNKCGIGLNGKCQEIYKDCTKYTGGESNKCTNIERDDLAYKCVFNSNACKNEKKICSDAKYETDCNKITPTDNDKQCAYIFYNNIYQCVEQYKTCDLYQTKVTSGQNQNDCESIILKSDSTKKCKFDNSKCTAVAKGCKDLFAPTQTLNECSALTYSNKEKCVFDSSNSSCSIKDKTCLEMTSLYGATEDDCKNAATSDSNKVCSVNALKTGCEEVEKKNSASKNNLSKIIIVLLALLF